MREVAKSMLGFSWAVSMFGVQQISRLVAGSSEPSSRTAAEIDEVARAIQGHLVGAPAMQYRMGDEWQRRVVDAMFDVATLRSVDPRKVASSLDPRNLVNSADPRKIVETGMTVFQRSVDTMKESVESVRQAVNASADRAKSAADA